MVTRHHYHFVQNSAAIYKKQIIQVLIIDYFVDINTVTIAAIDKKDGLWQPQMVKIRSMA